MLHYERITDFHPVYAYYLKIKATVPYWLDADYETWEKSFVSDCDYDGEEMFSQLYTSVARQGEEILGFIQYGIPNYLYDTNGEKDRTVRGGVIRMLHFAPESGCGEGLIRIAEDYFTAMHVQRRFAFFHAFGMSCNAGHGKLHCGLAYIEGALADFGYIKEHENVYYKLLLTDCSKSRDDCVQVKYEPVNPRGLQEFSLFAGGNWVGAGALVFLPQGKMCYLKWVYIDGNQQGKGYGAAALRNLIADLSEQGLERLDTDTADGNQIAQSLYRKVGFQDMGRTRSYYVL